MDEIQPFPTELIQNAEPLMNNYLEINCKDEFI